jgi:DNA-nicking Smr family endonuclease
MSGSDDSWVAFKACTRPLKRKNTVHEKVASKPFKPYIKSAPKIFERPWGEIPSLPVLSRKIRRQLMPEGKIDLHGMTLDEGYQNLIRFVRASCTQGKRVVLVVTGKGSLRVICQTNPTTLRQNLPLWVQTFPLKEWVVEYSVARNEHGGQGAYYLRLKAF